jgi:integrase
MRIVLTDRFVAGAKGDGSAQVEFFDAKTKGLSLRVSRKGVKSWSFSFTTPNGKRARVTLGSFPAVTLAAARGLALEARAAVQSGHDPRLHKAGAMTLAALIESYIAKHVRNLRSAKQIERRFRRNVLPIVGNVRLADLHRRDINRVVDPVLGRCCPIEANRVFGDLRAVLRWAIARGDLDRDPSAGMTAPSPRSSRDRTLSDDEIRRLWNALPNVFPNASVQRILRLCLVTAQRVGEVTGMQRGELDFKARLWSLPGTRTKNGFAHQVPLSDLAISIIEEAMADAAGSSRLFDLPAVAVARFVGRAQGKFGIFPPWTPHDLRRSAVSGMAALGVAPVVLGHIANHRGTTKAGITLAVYIRHDYSRERREALDLWAARLTAIVGDHAAAQVVPLRSA